MASKIFNATPYRHFSGQTAAPEELVTTEDGEGLNRISDAFSVISKSEHGIDLVSFEEKKAHYKFGEIVSAAENETHQFN
jgi:hypothetical protein